MRPDAPVPVRFRPREPRTVVRLRGPDQQRRPASARSHDRARPRTPLFSLLTRALDLRHAARPLERDGLPRRVTTYAHDGARYRTPIVRLADRTRRFYEVDARVMDVRAQLSSPVNEAVFLFLKAAHRIRLSLAALHTSDHGDMNETGFKALCIAWCQHYGIHVRSEQPVRDGAPEGYMDLVLHHGPVDMVVELKCLRAGFHVPHDGDAGLTFPLSAWRPRKQRERWQQIADHVSRLSLERLVLGTSFRRPQSGHGPTFRPPTLVPVYNILLDAHAQLARYLRDYRPRPQVTLLGFVMAAVVNRVVLSSPVRVAG